MTELRDVVLEDKDYGSLSDEDVRALNAFENVMKEETHPDDPPTPVEITGADARNIPAFIGYRNYWVRDADGSIAADGYAWWRKTEQNRHLAWISLSVRPDRRRRGLAKALLKALIPVVDEEGRTLLVGSTNERVPAGEALARRLGAEVGSAVHTNRLLLADVDRAMVRTWIDEGPRRAAGYSLITIDGRYPDDLVDEIATVYDVMNTAPLDDLDMEDVVHTAEQLRENEKRMNAAGTVRWSLFARHDESRRLIGFSEVYWNANNEPKTMGQGDTGVHPDHRGHAIGKWMKAAMIERIFAERPDVGDVRTGNADSNDAMLGINHALGFRPYIAHMNWQVPVERVRAYLDGSST